MDRLTYKHLNQPQPLFQLSVFNGCKSCKYYYLRNGELNQDIGLYFRKCVSLGIVLHPPLNCPNRKRLGRKRKKQLRKRGLI